jgi:hypothetical protein
MTEPSIQRIEYLIDPEPGGDPNLDPLGAEEGA